MPRRPRPTRAWQLPDAPPVPTGQAAALDASVGQELGLHSSSAILVISIPLPEVLLRTEAAHVHGLWPVPHFQ